MWQRLQTLLYPPSRDQPPLIQAFQELPPEVKEAISTAAKFFGLSDNDFIDVDFRIFVDELQKLIQLILLNIQSILSATLLACGTYYYLEWFKYQAVATLIASTMYFGFEPYLFKSILNQETPTLEANMARLTGSSRFIQVMVLFLAFLLVNLVYFLVAAVSRDRFITECCGIILEGLISLLNLTRISVVLRMPVDLQSFNTLVILVQWVCGELLPIDILALLFTGNLKHHTWYLIFTLCAIGILFFTVLFPCGECQSVRLAYLKLFPKRELSKNLPFDRFLDSLRSNPITAGPSLDIAMVATSSTSLNPSVEPQHFSTNMIRGNNRILLALGLHHLLESYIRLVEHLNNSWIFIFALLWFSDIQHIDYLRGAWQLGSLILVLHIFSKVPWVLFSYLTILFAYQCSTTSFISWCHQTLNFFLFEISLRHLNLVNFISICKNYPWEIIFGSTVLIGYGASPFYLLLTILCSFIPNLQVFRVIILCLSSIECGYRLFKHKTTDPFLASFWFVTKNNAV